MFTTSSHNYFWLAGPILCLLVFTTSAWSQDRQSVEENELVNARSAYIEGLAAFENENYEHALELLKAAYVKLPEHPGVNFALADAYIMLGNLANAEYYGKQATTLDPKNQWYHLKLATIYREMGKIEPAITQLQSGLEYHPRNSELLYELAQTYSDVNQLEKANQIYNRLLYLEGDNIGIRLQKLKHFNSLGMQDSALVELEKIRELDPNNVSTLQTLSSYYLKMDQPQKAQEALQNALKINSRNSKTLIMLADIYIEQKKWEGLDSLLADAVTDSPATVQEKTALAEHLFSQFDADSSNPRLKEILSTLLATLVESNPNSGKIQEIASEFFIKTNQNKAALQALKKTTELNPTNDSAWQRRLQVLLADGQVQEAISVGEQAAEQIPQNPIILYLLGNAHLTNGGYQQAVKYLDEAAALPARRPLKSNIFAALGNSHAALENWSQAFQDYDQSLKLDPDNAGVLNNYAYYLSLQNKQLSKAKEMAQKAIELDPQNASYLDTLGWIYYQSGDYNQAQKYIRAAIDTGEASAEVLEHLGDVLDKLDKPAEAKQWWQKALNKDSSRTHLKEKISANGD